MKYTIGQNHVFRFILKAYIIENHKDTTIIVDTSLRPFQKSLIGKKIGDKITLPNVNFTYEIKKILTLP